LVFCSNRDLFEEAFQPVYLKLVETSGLRMYLAQNEGGYSQTVSGHLVIEGRALHSDDLARKKINFKITSKGVDYFETVANL
jgi:hypothetical protein